MSKYCNKHPKLKYKDTFIGQACPVCQDNQLCDAVHKVGQRNRENNLLSGSQNVLIELLREIQNKISDQLEGVPTKEPDNVG